MNIAPDQDIVNLDELARLAPPPYAPALSAQRHARLRQQLVRDISDTGFRRRPRRAVLAAVAAAATAAVVVIAGTDVIVVRSVRNDSRHTATLRSVPATVTFRPGTTVGLTAFTRHITRAATRLPALTVRPDQYVYVRSLVAFTRPDITRVIGGAATLDPLHEREVWLSQRPTTTPGLIRENGTDETLYGADGDPTYASLSSLPLGAAALRHEIYTETAGRAPDKNGAAFDQIDQLIDENIVPPKVSAALFGVAASIPGVQLVPDAVDAAGRPGTALARTDHGERTELIFAAKTYAYLGERSYLVRRTPMGPAGMLTGSTAVLDRGVVNSIGELPAGQPQG